MKLYVICIKDRVADVFAQPQFVPSIGAGIRSFADAVNNKTPENILAKHPEDFDLFELGEYNDATAEFDCGAPRQIAIGKDLVK